MNSDQTVSLKKHGWVVTFIFMQKPQRAGGLRNPLGVF
jgi:hypothetical protein